MNLWARTMLLFKMKSSAALDAAEDAREVLDYAYAERVEVVNQVRRGLVEVATAHRRLERQMASVSEDERRLTQAYRQLCARLEEFRTHRDVVHATYTAAEAQVRVHESLAGVTGDLAE